MVVAYCGYCVALTDFSLSSLSRALVISWQGFCASRGPQNPISLGNFGTRWRRIRLVEHFTMSDVSGSVLGTGFRFRPSCRLNHEGRRDVKYLQGHRRLPWLRTACSMNNLTVPVSDLRTISTQYPPPEPEFQPNPPLTSQCRALARLVVVHQDVVGDRLLLRCGVSSLGADMQALPPASVHEHPPKSHP